MFSPKHNLPGALPTILFSDGPTLTPRSRE
jgi:hypothetical protein